MTAILRPDKSYAEIVRQRDPDTGRSMWVIDAVVIDPRDGTTQRVMLAEADSMRGILGEALALERRGYFVARGGLALVKDVYPAGPIKRRRRTAEQVEQLDRQILDVLRTDHPQSVRHVFYRMTDPRLPEPVEKSDAGYAQVQDRVAKLRRSRRLPYSWVSDATRRGYFVDTFSGADDFLRRMNGLYRADLWRNADKYCEVWCESRSIAGTIQDDCEELAVSLYPCGGFTSMTLAYQAAETMNYRTDNKPVVIFYIGDYDPAGVLIDVVLERELRTHLRPDIDMTFVRIGITPEQIEAHNLPTKPRKDKDRRALHVQHSVEAEAMPAHILRTLLRNAVEDLLPPDALEVARAAEESERDFISSLADAIGGWK